MPFSNCVSFNYALHQLDLFDEIEGKYLKYYFQGNLDLDEYDFEVDIEEVEKEGSRRGYVLIVEYELKNPNWVYRNNEIGWKNVMNIPEYITFTTELDYHANSPLAWLIGQDLYEETEDEEEEDEEEDEEKPLCKDCEIETKKYCDVCGGYGSEDDEDEEDISQYKKMCIYFECQDGEKEIVDLSNWILEDGTGNDEMFFDECEEPCFVDRELERYVCLEYIKNNLVE